MAYTKNFSSELIAELDASKAELRVNLLKLENVSSFEKTVLPVETKENEPWNEWDDEAADLIGDALQALQDKIDELVAAYGDTAGDKLLADYGKAIEFWGRYDAAIAEFRQKWQAQLSSERVWINARAISIALEARKQTKAYTKDELNAELRRLFDALVVAAKEARKLQRAVLEFRRRRDCGSVEYRNTKGELECVKARFARRRDDVETLCGGRPELRRLARDFAALRAVPQNDGHPEAYIRAFLTALERRDVAQAQDHVDFANLL